MDFLTFVYLQFMGHIAADFFFQTDRLAKDKNEKGFRSKFLVWHILIVFSCSWLLSFQMEFVVAAAIIAITHYFIDGNKPKLNRHPSLKRYAFFIDQLLHLFMLILVTYLFDQYHGIEPLWEVALYRKEVVLLLSFLVCLKPANILIKEVFKTAQLDIMSANELPNAGKLIGVLERLLTLLFILIGQFEAVGFLIAAKSILRYRDDETLKTEYVLIGTMLSFGIAVVMGIFAGSIY